MGTIVAVTAGLCIWIAMWALNIQAIVGIIVTILIVVVAMMVRMLLPHLPGNTRD
jgi:uncharacterized membrane protein YbhN (UPF0104 family)